MHADLSAITHYFPIKLRKFHSQKLDESFLILEP